MDPNFPTIPTPPRNTALWPAADFPAARAKMEEFAGMAEALLAVAELGVKTFEGRRQRAEKWARHSLQAIRLCSESEYLEIRDFAGRIKESGDVDVREDNADGFTALMWAIFWNQSDLVAELFSAGADPDQCDTSDGSPAHMWTTNASMLQLIFAAGADPNKANKIGLTKLIVAAREGRIDLVRVTLDHPKIDLSANNQGKIAFEYAGTASLDSNGRRDDTHTDEIRELVAAKMIEQKLEVYGFPKI